MQCKAMKSKAQQSDEKQNNANEALPSQKNNKFKVINNWGRAGFIQIGSALRLLIGSNTTGGLVRSKFALGSPKEPAPGAWFPDPKSAAKDAKDVKKCFRVA